MQYAQSLICYCTHMLLGSTCLYAYAPHAPQYEYPACLCGLTNGSQGHTNPLTADLVYQCESWFSTVRIRCYDGSCWRVRDTGLG